MSETLQDFLIAIDYKVNDAAEQKVQKGLKNNTYLAVELGKAFLEAAQTVVNAAERMAKAMDELYFTSMRTGAAVEGIKALQFAAAQLGSSGAAALSALESITKLIATNPAGESFLASLGVVTRDTNGKLLDTTKIMGNLGQVLKSMPLPTANYIASFLGIDYKTLLAMREGLGGFSAEYHTMYAAAHIDGQVATKDANYLMTELRTLGGAFDILGDKVNAVLARRIGDDVRRFRVLIVNHFEQIAHVIEVVSNAILTFADVITTLAMRGGQAIDQVVRWFGSLDNRAKEVIIAVGLLAGAWKLLNIAFSLSPIGRVIALGSALLLLYDDFQTWKEGGKSLIDWDKWKHELDAAGAGLWWFHHYWVNLHDVVVNDVWPALKGFYDDMRPKLVALWNETTPYLIEAWGYFKQFATWLRDTAWPAFRDFAIDAAPVMVDLFRTIGHELVLAWNDLKDFVEWLRDTALHYIHDFAIAAAPVMVDLFRTIGQRCILAWNDLKAFVEWLRDTALPYIHDFCVAIGLDFSKTFSLDLKENLKHALAELKGFVEFLKNTLALINAIDNHDIPGAIAAGKALFAQSGVAEGMAPQPDTPASGLRDWWSRTAPTWLGGDASPNSVRHPQEGGAAINQRVAAGEAFEFWKGKGFTDAGAYAMVATEQRESGFNPAARGDKDPVTGAMTAHGLYQHHADRRAAILKATGIDMSTATAAQQREGLFQEMKRVLDPQAAAALPILMNSNDIPTTTGATVNGIERPKDRAGAQAADAAVASQWSHIGLDPRTDGPSTPGFYYAPSVQDAINQRIEQMRNMGSGDLTGGGTPALGTGAAGGGGPITLSQTTEINVNGAGDPMSIGEHVLRNQERVNQAATRNLGSAVR